MSLRVSLRTSLLVFVLLAVALPATASAQATRTWVSGTGDDSFPCSRTAPCKTWAGAISKTQEGGEINVVDNGAFGALNITKSLTIDGNNAHASTLMCGAASNGFNINADPTDKVTIRNLRFNGCKNTSQLAGTAGVQINQAGSVRIEDSRIFNWSQSGVRFEPTNANARLIVEDTRIYDNGNYGVLARPKAGGGGARVTMHDVRIDDNGNGLVMSSLNASIRGRLFDSTIIDSGQDGGTGHGVWATGNNASVRIGDSRIVGNNTGLKTTNGSLISYGGNIVDDNTVDGDFTSNVARK